MQPNRINNISECGHLAGLAAGDDTSTLTDIYKDNVNIAIWQRQPQPMLDSYASQWISQHPLHTPRLILSLNNLNNELEKLLHEEKHNDIFQNDVAFLIDMFACLFDVQEVGLRITPLKTAMCPRFHVDKIPCRLVTTYGGLGTEWLQEDNIDRSRLGRGANGLPDDQSGIIQGDKTIQQVSNQQVALLKGSGWIGNEERGLVHRSPSLSDDQKRLLLTLDFC